MAVYNCEKYIFETISSVINQTYKDWELLIVDDGSTDNTKKIIEKFLLDLRIKYFYQKNQKQAKARNLAFKHSTGIFLAILDADDMWSSDKLEKQVKLMESDERIGLVYTAFQIMDKNSILQKNIYNVDVTSNPLYYQIQENSIAFSSMMIRRGAIEGELHDEKYPHNGDTYLTLRLASSGWKFGFIDEALLYYRITDQGISHNLEALKSCFKEQMIFFQNESMKEKSFFSNRTLRKLFLSNTYIKYGKGLIYYNCKDDLTNAKNYLIDAIRLNKKPKFVYSIAKGFIKMYLNNFFRKLKKI